MFRVKTESSFQIWRDVLLIIVELATGKTLASCARNTLGSESTLLITRVKESPSLTLRKTLMRASMLPSNGFISVPRSSNSRSLKASACISEEEASGPSSPRHSIMFPLHSLSVPINFRSSGSSTRRSVFSVNVTIIANVTWSFVPRNHSWASLIKSRSFSDHPALLTSQGEIAIGVFDPLGI